jgi:hypothetical protein
MRKILFSMLALGAMTGAALAEPQKMSEAQLEGVAGGVSSSSVSQNNWLFQSAFALALSGGEVPAMATAGNTAGQTNNGGSSATSTVLPQITLPPMDISVP